MQENSRVQWEAVWQGLEKKKIWEHTENPTSTFDKYLLFIGADGKPFSFLLE